MDKLWYLSKVNIFDALPQEDLMEIGKMAPMRQTKKGTIVISPDNQDEILYFLKKGKVRIYKLNSEGKTKEPVLVLKSMDTIWIQVAGTKCNLSCAHCFISCGPDNDSHRMMSIENVRDNVERGIAQGAVMLSI